QPTRGKTRAAEGQVVRRCEKNIAMRIVWLIGLGFTPALVQAEWNGAPKFSDFPAIEKARAQPVAVDLSSHRYARRYRTTLRKAVAKGANFAGHYVFAWWGCGNESFQSLVVDLDTGRVYGIAKTQKPLETSRGADLNIDSRLLVT